jgi:hypothetical protein
MIFWNTCTNYPFRDYFCPPFFFWTFPKDLNSLPELDEIIKSINLLK